MLGITFGSCDVEKAHAVVARSTFRSQNAQNTPRSELLLEVVMWKSARRCGAKHISRSKVENWRVGRDVEKVHAVVVRSTFRSQKCKKTDGFRALLDVQMWQEQGIVHLVKTEQNLRVLWHFLKRWQAWDICKGSGKMSFAWQVQYNRHDHQRC